MEEERPTEAVAALFLDESDPALLPEAGLARGTMVSGYVIDEQIGKGATGVVYAATHPLIGKRVAIKVLRHDLCDDPQSVERFMLEARSVNEIGHPNIVDIFDLGALPDGRRYLIMDLLLGRTLRRRLGSGPLHVTEAATVIDEVASAMMAAHAKGFIHRDLKPDNVFLVEVPGERPEVRLLDFGLVKLVAANHPSGSGIRTRNGIVIGTPQYMSPEQARAKNVDHRTDIYALGVMAFELLSGRRPYDRPSILEVLIAHAEAPIPSLQQRVPSLPIEVTQLVEAMLAKQAADRPTLAAVRTVIKRLIGTVIPTITQAHEQIRAASEPKPEVDKPAQQSTHTLPTRRSKPQSAAEAMNAMPAYATEPTTSPAGSLSLPKVISKGTPSLPKREPSKKFATPPTYEVEVYEQPPPPAKSSRGLFVVFAIAAVIVAAGGVLLGMSL
jgi:serine/threonine protein kinase